MRMTFHPCPLAFQSGRSHLYHLHANEKYPSLGTQSTSGGTNKLEAGNAEEGPV